MAKVKTKFFCTECGYETPKWMGKCPGCGEWNTMVEERETVIKTAGVHSSLIQTKEKPQSIIHIESGREPRLTTTLSELNRVLGGGVVPGSLILVGGDPGIGKSTLLLQTSNALAASGLKVLYVSGEESMRQTKLRADRLGVLSENLFVLSETNLQYIEEALEAAQPDFLVIDSIQTVFQPSVESAPGSVAQVRECTSTFMRIAKGKGIATVLVGHVTKEGAIAGPRLLEHMVDCVLYFEGERHHSYRILRAVKNRFGSTNEIGIFEMTEGGLVEVKNPSEMFLQERPLGVAGSTVVASLEGTRPVLVEMQALVSATNFPSPRRMATGIDHHRLALIIAVLEKRMGMFLQNQDAYVNVAGGIKLDEPAVDLAMAVAIASSFRDMPTQPFDVVFGEVGLTGEVRGVSRAEQRVKEAEKLGFKRIILPEKSLRGWKPPANIEIIGVNTVAEALAVALG
ncbi:DNA repair protein RadA [Paenibacillus sp. E194]|jgi:DNA repair protein RadA/Sms|uniref:DNA repair protein RadA n=3 Tax=Paenibacillus TaxID=44249 RepID=S9SRY5_PAEAL|nr:MULTISPECIES: DNA repair protein RadA [Paenibacillus]EPY06913.1 DNA repair protein RadA [Paenibacillus alvei TS-15]EPY14604.1 DNA repair protein RadA [Paenibacillus alvei A6-6i-x]KJB88341.1 DNA repair protein RadA [Paenibacillus sp. E194]MCM3293692.1 DNA repair protein RadA [Paenibacillus sp. MER 180]MCY9533230.1 DNA repair protein RadA [Paenibacillus alvei]